MSSRLHAEFWVLVFGTLNGMTHNARLVPSMKNNKHEAVTHQASCGPSHKFFKIITINSTTKMEKKNLKQSWLPAFWKKIQNTQEIKRTLFN